MANHITKEGDTTLTAILAQAADLFVSQQSSAHTQRAYRQDLGRLFDFCDPALGVQPDDAIRFRNHLSATLAPASAARVYATCRAFYRFAQQTGALPQGVNPFELVKGPKRIQNQTPEVPSDADVEALVSAAKPDHKWSLVIALLLNGLRAQEVCDLTKDDIRRTPDGILLRVVGKGMKERLVPATQETLNAMASYGMRGSESQDLSRWVVSDFNGSQMTPRQVEHAVYKSAEYAGVEGMHPHALRHHYATRLIRAGASVLHVQRLLGHSRADTTQVYVTLDTSDLFEAARKDPRNQQQPTLTVVAA